VSTGGFIYAIGAEGSPYVKIGSTHTAINKRLRQLQSGHPARLTVRASVAVASHGHKIEKIIHQFLADVRQQGEWFAATIDQESLEALTVRAVQWIEEDRARETAKIVHQQTRRRGPSLDSVTQLGQRVRMRRLRLRLSQEQLGSQIGHDQGYVSRLERGEIADITVRTLARLADALRVSTDYLLGRKDEESEPLPTAVA
jgi:ribosome-binding protein aMBF1 (putative translation factor)